MANEFVRFCVGILLIDGLYGQTCKPAHDRYTLSDPEHLRDYLVENTDIVCYDLNLLSSEDIPCSNAKHASELIPMNCVRIGAESCGCIGLERHADVVIMMNAVHLTDKSWSSFFIPFIKKMNNAVLRITKEYINWKYIIYGDNENDLIISQYPENTLNNNILPSQYIGNKNGDYCSALKAAMNTVKQGKHDSKILISFNFGEPNINYECLNDDGKPIHFSDEFTVVGSFSTLDFSHINMQNIESTFGVFTDCVYLDDYSNIIHSDAFNASIIYDNFYLSGDPVLSKFVGPISDYICHNAISPKMTN